MYCNGKVIGIRHYKLSSGKYGMEEIKESESPLFRLTKSRYAISARFNFSKKADSKNSSVKEYDAGSCYKPKVSWEDVLELIKYKKELERKRLFGE